MSTRPSIDVSIIIVSWNVADLLRSCLESILNSTDVCFDDSASGHNILTEIIVVDSASNDNTVSMITTEFPHVTLLAQTENVGFTQGNNIGFAHANGRYHFLLNPDTEVMHDTISRMVNYLEDQPDVGILGPHTLNTDGTTQSSRRRFPTIAVGFFESTWLQSFAPKSLLNTYYVTDQPDDAVFDVDWVQGSAILARNDVYRSISGLDTDFIMYSEELDWCKRAKSKGWRVVYYGQAQIIHHGGKSSEQSGARKHILFQQSKLRYFRKYHGKFVAILLRIFLILNYVWQIVIETCKSLLGSQRPMRQKRIRTYWQVLKSGLKVN